MASPSACRGWFLFSLEVPWAARVGLAAAQSSDTR